MRTPQAKTTIHCEIPEVRTSNQMALLDQRIAEAVFIVPEFGRTYIFYRKKSSRRQTLWGLLFLRNLHLV